MANKTGTKGSAAIEQTAKDEAERSQRDEERQRNERVQAEARALLDLEAEAIRQADLRNPVLPSLRTNPFGAAQIVLERYFTKDGARLLIYYREDWYQYKRQRWSLATKRDVESALYKRLLLCRQVDAEGDVHDFVTSPNNVAVLYFQLEKNETVPSDVAVPCAREPDGSWHEVDGQGQMVCLGEIVNMLTGTSKSTLHTFVPNGADWRYDPDAPPPKRWLRFLTELFGDRPDEIALLQEWFGYVLSGDRWAQKALLIVGPKRAGKGTIGEVLRRLLGKSMVSSPAINAIGERFGLQDSINKRLLLVSDARLSSKKDTMAVVENLLRIIGNDPVMVDRKSKEPITDQLGVRVMMLSNEMPRLSDSSDAISSRFLILRLSRSFYESEESDLIDKLTVELPGIACWSMTGYRRLRKRARFAEPDSSKQARQDWYETGSPLAEFVNDYCVREPDAKCAPTAFTKQYNEWREWHRMPVIAANKLSAELFAMYGQEVSRGYEGSQRRWCGIRLRSTEELTKAGLPLPPF
jgi:putative DNA primase/helicase